MLAVGETQGQNYDTKTYTSRHACMVIPKRGQGLKEGNREI